jgi:hypothetical protein
MKLEVELVGSLTHGVELLCQFSRSEFFRRNRIHGEFVHISWSWT